MAKGFALSDAKAAASHRLHGHPFNSSCWAFGHFKWTQIHLNSPSAECVEGNSQVLVADLTVWLDLFSARLKIKDGWVFEAAHFYSANLWWWVEMETEKYKHPSTLSDLVCYSAKAYFSTNKKLFPANVEMVSLSKFLLFQILSFDQVRDPKQQPFLKGSKLSANSTII